MTEGIPTPALDDETAMRSYLQRIATGPELSKDISLEEARHGMQLILEGRADPVQAGIFLIALRMKRETDDETRGILEAIRQATIRVEADVDHVVDMADPYDGFNRTLPVSPFLPAVLAACGVAAFSHGVRSVGPKFGATHSQVLEVAGVEIDGTPEQIAARLADPAVGWGYLDQSRFCPQLHALIELRRLIVKRPAVTTTEVLAGPITGRVATHLVTGFVHKPYPRIYALLARHAGYESAMLVRGTEGGVVPSLRQAGKIWHYHARGEEREVDIDPQSLGIEQELRAVPLPEDLPGYRAKTDGVATGVDAGAIAEAAARAGVEALEGKRGAAFDSLVYGAALTLWHLGRHASLAEAADRVREVLTGGQALARLRA
ncbi:MAG: anthranilate phosphoribosyltransferase [Gammaproteobacteria bacterium]|nr:anthranilate phosphoribosyltransferase [Gammaproteobacteria bacterium]